MTEETPFVTADFLLYFKIFSKKAASSDVFLKRNHDLSYYLNRGCEIKSRFRTAQILSERR